MEESTQSPSQPLESTTQPSQKEVGEAQTPVEEKEGSRSQAQEQTCP